MGDFVTAVNDWLGWINDLLWHPWVLFFVMGVGILFTVWSGFCQYHSLTHGIAVTAGRYDNKNDPGAISHFQALSAALSATVGIGNIGGVAVAISLGGPGAVFWMWVVGFIGMALKTIEVTLAMLYRNTKDPENPHGGPMWVAGQGMAQWGQGAGRLGKTLAWIFCVTLLIGTITGGNMFQAWNVAEVTASNFKVPKIIVGVILAVVCAAVIIGGIKRIGAVAGALVPFMCGVYLLAGVYVLIYHINDLPEMFGLIFRGAFSTLEGENAFVGGTAGYAFLWGMKRALFSNEAGQGSSPIAHSAARTHEPVREGVVAGLEPFIDTLVVCTLTALVILATGAWRRGPEVHFPARPTVVAATDSNGKVIEGKWTIQETALPSRPGEDWHPRDSVFVVVDADPDPNTAAALHRLSGTVVGEEGKALKIEWDTLSSDRQPQAVGTGLYAGYTSASLTSHAFDRVHPGLGKYMVTFAVWLFAISTVISWSYYGEQASVYLFGDRSVVSYRYLYCVLLFVACLDFIRTDQELDNLSSLGTGLMLIANIPICLIFARQAIGTYRDYIRRLKAGDFEKERVGRT